MPATSGIDHISAFIEVPPKFSLKMQNLTSLTVIDFSIQTHYKLVKVAIKAQVDQVFVVSGGISRSEGCNKFPGAAWRLINITLACSDKPEGNSRALG